MIMEIILRQPNPESNRLIPIFFAVDDNYAPLLHVALESIVSQASKAYRYHVHILCENLSAWNQESFLKYGKENFCVYITDMAARIAGRAKLMHTRDYYSKTTYFRVYIPEMFPEYDKALYLDCDIALNADVSELYNFEIGDAYVGGVTCEAVDTTPTFTEYAEAYLGFRLPKYFNAGVLVMNLEALRKINFSRRFFDIMEKIKFEVAQDQDYLNVLCKDNVVFLPKAWNKIPRPSSTDKLADLKLVHYNLAFRPWRYDGVLYGELFWKHAKKTPVYEQLLDMKRSFSEQDAARDRQWMTNLLNMAREQAERRDTFYSKLLSGQIVLMG